MPYNFKNIIFEGGGVKGIAYGGALKVLDEMKILHYHPAGAAAAPGDVAGVRLAPAPGLHVNLTLVLGILGFAIDAFKF